LIYLPPDKYSQGSAALYVSVSFDRPMNRESVEKALSISPPVQGGYFVWFQNTRKFTASSEASTYRWDGASFYDTLSIGVVSELKMALDFAAPTNPSAEISTHFPRRNRYVGNAARYGADVLFQNRAVRGGL
jgi:hypothetical protein